MDCRYRAAAASSVATSPALPASTAVRGRGRRELLPLCGGGRLEELPVHGRRPRVEFLERVRRRGIEPGCLGVGLGSGQDGQAPHQGLTLVEVDGWVDRPDHVGDGVERVPRGHGVVDRGDQGGPPGACGKVVRAVVPEVLGELAGPAWCEVVLGRRGAWRRRGRGGG